MCVGGAGAGGAGGAGARRARIAPSNDGSKLPGSGASGSVLKAFAGLVQAATRHPLTLFASVRGDVLVDSAAILWEHSNK